VYLNRISIALTTGLQLYGLGEAVRVERCAAKVDVHHALFFIIALGRGTVTERPIVCSAN